LKDTPSRLGDYQPNWRQRVPHHCAGDLIDRRLELVIVQELPHQQASGTQTWEVATNCHTSARLEVAGELFARTTGERGIDIQHTGSITGQRSIRQSGLNHMVLIGFS